MLHEFFSKYDLVSIWSKFPADFTYVHHTMTAFSTIDHFMVTPSFLDNCVSAAPIHRGDNRSGHEPIMLKFKVPKVAEKLSPKPVTVKKPSWLKAEEEDIQNYTQVLHSKLSDLQMPK